MDFRDAVLFLMNHFEDHELPNSRLLAVADALVLETAPMTAETIARKIFIPSVHRDRKINFIKDIRAEGSRVGMTIGLVDAKDAAETILSEYHIEMLRQKLVGEGAPEWEAQPLEEDEDGSLAFARMLERKAEATYDYNEEPF
jgi:hypothetical protein